MNEVKMQIKPMELARKLGIPPTTVYSWKKIPKWREDAVLKALKEKRKEEQKGN